MNGEFFSLLPVLIAGAVFLLLGFFVFLSAQRAFERSRKSLSWVHRHGKVGYPFARARFSAQPADWLGVFGVAVFALVSAMVCTALRSYFSGNDWLSGLFTLTAMGTVLIDVGGTVALYFLLQRFFGSTLIAACGSLLYAAAFFGAHTAASMLAVSLLLLVLYLNADPERSFPQELLYFGAVLALMATLGLAPQLLPFALLYLGLHLHRHVDRLRREQQSWPMLLLCLLLSVSVWLLGLVPFVAAALFFRYPPSAMPTFLSAPMQYSGKLVLGELGRVVTLFAPSRAVAPLVAAPYLGLGVFGIVSAILLLRRRRDPRSILMLLIAGVSVLVWALSGCSVLALGLTLPVCLLFSNYERGSRRWPVVVLTLGTLAYELGLYVLARYLPLAPSIVEHFA